MQHLKQTLSKEKSRDEIECILTEFDHTRSDYPTYSLKVRKVLHTIVLQTIASYDCDDEFGDRW